MVDFGLARVGLEDQSPEVDSVEHAQLRAQGRITLSGVVAGTLGYMSPEQYRGGNVDARSDQWSFCASLFEALYGQLPFAGKTLAEYAESVYGRPRAQPRNSPVPEEIHRALLRGLQAEPSRRFPSMDSLLAALSQEHVDDVASGRNLRTLFARAAIAVCLLVFTGFQIRLWDHPPTHREPIIASVVLLSVTLLGGLARWQTLRSQRIHRSAWLLMCVTMGQNFLLRLLGWLSELPRTQVVPLELVVIAGSTLFGTLSLLRRGHWISLVPLVSAFLIHGEVMPTRVGAVAHLLSVVLFFAMWQRAASDVSEQRALRSRSSSRSAKSDRSRSSPSDGSSQPIVK